MRLLFGVAATDPVTFTGIGLPAGRVIIGGLKGAATMRG